MRRGRSIKVRSAGGRVQQLEALSTNQTLCPMGHRVESFTSRFKIADPLKHRQFRLLRAKQDFRGGPGQHGLSDEGRLNPELEHLLDTIDIVMAG